MDSQEREIFIKALKDAESFLKFNQNQIREYPFNQHAIDLAKKLERLRNVLEEERDVSKSNDNQK